LRQINRSLQKAAGRGLGLRSLTAGRELHPAPKVYINLFSGDYTFLA